MTYCTQCGLLTHACCENFDDGVIEIPEDDIAEYGLDEQKWSCERNERIRQYIRARE